MAILEEQPDVGISLLPYEQQRAQPVCRSLPGTAGYVPALLFAACKHLLFVLLLSKFSSCCTDSPLSRLNSLLSAVVSKG